MPTHHVYLWDGRVCSQVGRAGHGPWGTNAPYSECTARVQPWRLVTMLFALPQPWPGLRGRTGRRALSSPCLPPARPFRSSLPRKRACDPQPRAQTQIHTDPLQSTPYVRVLSVRGGWLVSGWQCRSGHSGGAGEGHSAGHYSAGRRGSLWHLPVGTCHQRHQHSAWPVGAAHGGDVRGPQLLLVSCHLSIRLACRAQRRPSPTDVQFCRTDPPAYSIGVAKVRHNNPLSLLLGHHQGPTTPTIPWVPPHCPGAPTDLLLSSRTHPSNLRPAASNTAWTPPAVPPAQIRASPPPCAA